MKGIDGMEIACSYSINNYKLDNKVLIRNAFFCEGNAKYTCDERRYFVEGIAKSSYFEEKKKPTDLDSLMFRDRQSLEYIPVGIDAFFPNLKVFSCYDCIVYYIEKADLEQMPNLIGLHLDHNKLTYLPADLFESTPNLLVLSLSKNPIATVGLGIFRPIKKLKALYFAETKCRPSSTDQQVDETELQIIELCKEKTRRINVETTSIGNSTTRVKRSMSPEDIERCEDTYIFKEELAYLLKPKGQSR